MSEILAAFVGCLLGSIAGNYLYQRFRRHKKHRVLVSYTVGRRRQRPAAENSPNPATHGNGETIQ